MNKKQELNAFIKDCITTALIKQMETQSLDKISVTELVKTAGVSRVSLYRNFESKQDVLEKHLMKLIQEWGKEFEEKNDAAYFSESLLLHFYKYKDFYLLLNRQGLSSLIYENIRQATKLEESQNNVERYLKSSVAGAIFGWIDEWLRQGMKESPQEIQAIIAMAEQKQQKTEQNQN